MSEYKPVLMTNPKDAHQDCFAGMWAFQSGQAWFLRLPPGHPSGLVYEPTAIQITQAIANLYAIKQLMNDGDPFL